MEECAQYFATEPFTCDSIPIPRTTSFCELLSQPHLFSIRDPTFFTSGERPDTGVERRYYPSKMSNGYINPNSCSFIRELSLFSTRIWSSNDRHVRTGGCPETARLESSKHNGSNKPWMTPSSKATASSYFPIFRSMWRWVNRITSYSLKQLAFTKAPHKPALDPIPL